MKNDFKKIKEEIKLSHREKGEVFSTIQDFMKENPAKSPFSPHLSGWTIFQRASASFAVMVIVLGSSASLYAESSLPGDILYPMKINFNEKIIESVAWSDEDKARTNMSLSERRINEIEQVVKSQDLDPEDLAMAVDSLKDHSQKAISSIIDTSENGDDQTSKDLSEKFEAVLDSYDVSTSTIDYEATGTEETSLALYKIAAEDQPTEDDSTSTDDLLIQVQSIIDEHQDTLQDHIEDIEDDQATSTSTPPTNN